MKRKSDESKKSDESGRRSGGRVLAGSIIVIVGVGLLLQNIFPWFNFNYVWPLIIVAVGVYLLLRRPK